MSSAKLSPPRRFAARIQEAARNPYVDVPPAVSRAFAPFADARQIRISGVLNDVSIRGSLVPTRGGGHRLYINGGMRAAAGVGVGDRIRLELRALSIGVVVEPDDVAAELDARPGARAAFEALPPSARREWLRHIDDARTVANRAKRIRGTVDQLLGAEPARPTARPTRELWTCPRCGTQFVTRNMNHSCRRYTVEQTFAGRPAEIRRLFERLRTMVAAVGPFTEVAYSDRVAFMVRVRFAGAVPRNRFLQVSFWLTRRDDNPRFRRIETIGPMAHIHTLAITRADELDQEVAGWVAESYAVGRQEHLRQPGG